MHKTLSPISSTTQIIYIINLLHKTAYIIYLILVFINIYV